MPWGRRHQGVTTPRPRRPCRTVYWQCQQWEQRQVTERILEEQREQARVQEGREPEPSVGIIDSQSVKAADTVGRDSRGYDAGKKVNGRKRFIVTDTLGLRRPWRGSSCR